MLVTPEDNRVFSRLVALETVSRALMRVTPRRRASPHAYHGLNMGMLVTGVVLANASMDVAMHDNKLV